LLQVYPPHWPLAGMTSYRNIPKQVYCSYLNSAFGRLPAHLPSLGDPI
jgi:hypothetical protein